MLKHLSTNVESVARTIDKQQTIANKTTETQTH